MLTGVVDVLADEDDGGALVVDYKTDRLAPERRPRGVVERDYGVQRRIYALAALRAGAPDVEVAHLFLERPAEPAVAATFTPSDVAAARGRAARAAAGRAGGALRGRARAAPRPVRRLPGPPRAVPLARGAHRPRASAA